MFVCLLLGVLFMHGEDGSHTDCSLRLWLECRRREGGEEGSLLCSSVLGMFLRRGNVFDGAYIARPRGLGLL